MARGSVSDFSVERILSRQFGQTDGSSLDWTVQSRLGPESSSFMAPLPAPVLAPVPSCLQYRGMIFCPCAAAFQGFCTMLSPTHTDGSSPLSVPTLEGQTGSQQPGSPPRTRHKSRIRTVFTESQSRQLEALFEATEYPKVEARVELGQRTGLSQETVRVWFKNRRARRKRRVACTKTRLPSDPAERPDGAPSGPEARQQHGFSVRDRTRTEQNS